MATLDPPLAARALSRENSKLRRMGDTLDSQAAAFAHLLKLSGDSDAAFKSAVALADGLFPHQIEGVAFLLGRRRAILADDMGLARRARRSCRSATSRLADPDWSSVPHRSSATGRVRSSWSRRTVRSW